MLNSPPQQAQRQDSTVIAGADILRDQHDMFRPESLGGSMEFGAFKAPVASFKQNAQPHLAPR